MTEPATYTIEPANAELQRIGYTVTVYQHGTYPRTSVLAGQPRRQFIEAFRTVDEAKLDYPTATVYEWSTKVDIELPHAAPSWFDEADAGERWDNDY